MEETERLYQERERLFSRLRIELTRLGEGRYEVGE